MAYSPHNKTQIVNMALALLGEGEIPDFTSDTSESARQCRLHFDLTRDSMLCDHPWNFAIKRVSLVLGATPVSGYEYAFALPVDFLRAIEVNDTEAWEVGDKFAIEDGFLLCNEGTATVRYVASMTDTSKWDPLFIDAFIYVLAAKVTAAIADAPGTADALRSRGQYLIGEAKKRDANENNKREPSNAGRSLLVNRRGLRTSSRPDLTFRDY